MAGPDPYFCYVCLRRHDPASAIGGSHGRFDIEADASTSPAQARIREFYLQTKGVDAALRILGFEGITIRPPRFGRGWPPAEEIERRYRALAKGAHPDAGGDPEAFRRIRWAVDILRRYRPPEEYRA